MFLATLVAIVCGVAAFHKPIVIGGYGLPALTLAIITAGAAFTALRRLLRVARSLRGRA
jgi:hypothetical protein